MAKLRCPSCRQTESFGVEHLSSVEWVWDQTVEDYLHGVADPGEPHGGDQAVTTCTACMFTAPLLQFELPELPEPERRRRGALLGAVAMGAAALAGPAAHLGLASALASVA
jgi:hypothetical protein